MLKLRIRWGLIISRGFPLGFKFAIYCTWLRLPYPARGTAKTVYRGSRSIIITSVRHDADNSFAGT